MDYTNQGRCAKTRVACSTGGSGLVRNVIGWRNTHIKGCDAVAQRAISARVRVIAHKELTGARRHVDAWSCLKSGVRRCCRNRVFVHASPDATGIVAAVTAGGHTGVDHRRRWCSIAERGTAKGRRGIGGHQTRWHAAQMAAFAGRRRWQVRCGACR